MKNRIQIAALLMRVLSSLGISKTESEIVDVIELPKDRSLGDWALPCFLISRELKRQPQAIAQQIAESIVALLP